MNIIHYILGIPPLRGGGLVKYAMDLATAQSQMGHDVCILYPGSIKKDDNVQRIRSKKKEGNVIYFEIINPLPVSMASGMCDTKRFMEKADKKVYEKFFEKKDTQVLHIHSLMGLHLELVEAAKKLNVKVVFTSHDYFGVCPKSNFMYQNRICQDVFWDNCEQCCNAPDSYKVIIRRQSHWFELYTKCKLLVWIVKKMKNILKREQNNTKHFVDSLHIELNSYNNYQELKKYYEKIFSLVDCMHYNSSLAKQMYERVLGEKKNVVLQVLHREIVDKRKKRICTNTVRFGFLGNGETYKGFEMLKEIFDVLWELKKNKFILNVYFDWKGREEYIQAHSRYEYNEIDRVFEAMDILLVPSLWAETYGFVVLEAIMHGVPVIVSENVGAKDFLLKIGDIGKVVKADKESWSRVLLGVIENPTEIAEMSKKICNADIVVDYKEYSNKIIRLYQGL